MTCRNKTPKCTVPEPALLTNASLLTAHHQREIACRPAACSSIKKHLSSCCFGSILGDFLKQSTAKWNNHVAEGDSELRWVAAWRSHAVPPSMRHPSEQPVSKNNMLRGQQRHFRCRIGAARPGFAPGTRTSVLPHGQPCQANEQSIGIHQGVFLFRLVHGGVFWKKQ